MSNIVKFLISSLVIIALVLGYLYSKRVYVNDREIECGELESKVGLIKNIPSLVYTCDVSFKLTNLTHKNINVDYRIKNITYKPTNKIQGGSIQFGFFRSGSVRLHPRQTKIIELEIESRWNYETLEVETWVKE